MKHRPMERMEKLPMTSNTENQLTTPDGIAVALSTAERRLALLGLVDYEAAWEGLLFATAFVADGAAKRQLIETRVRPLANVLTFLTQRIDPLDLMAARHWFRHAQVDAEATAGS